VFRRRRSGLLGLLPRLLAREIVAGVVDAAQERYGRLDLHL
jgi:hypothetical protein